MKIGFLGDIFPGEQNYTINYGILSQFKSHNGDKWEKDIKSITNECDYVIGNLESPLVRTDKAQKKIFRGDPEFALFLKKVGINILNIANNHILEHGSEGFYNTIEILHNYDIDVIGYIHNNQPVIVYKNYNGIKIGIAGFSNVDLDKFDNNNHFPVLDDFNVLNTLSRMKSDRVDYKILVFHWGDEYINVPSLHQRLSAQKYIDKGASIIIGHHPHVIQPYEEYNDGHIFYSLGNFIFDYLPSFNVRMGLSVYIKLLKHSKPLVSYKGIQLSDGKLVRLSENKIFEKHYRRISNNYDKMLSLTHSDYKHKYRLSKRINRLKQRIKMKFFLIVELLNIDKSDKLHLVSNVANHYLSILKTYMK